MDQRHLLMHQVMLGDRHRLERYEQALGGVLRPGMTVADVGAGTLALTALALRHGAAHVYAVEADPEMLAVAERIIEANDWKDRVTLVAGDARRIRLPGLVDVIVAELMGNLGPEEGMVPILRALSRTSLRPGGVVIPARLQSMLAPIEFDDEGWGVWRDGFLDMRLRVVQEYIKAEAQLHFFTRPPVSLGEPVPLCDSAAGNRIESAPRLPIAQAGLLQAVIGYFVATLAPGITLSNLPSYPGCNWAVWVWPVRHTPVQRGDAVRVRVRRPAESRIVTDWRLDCQLVRAGTG